jgi:uncharacterized membrane protein
MKSFQNTLNDFDKVVSIAPKDKQKLTFNLNSLEKKSKDKDYELIDIEKEIINLISNNPGIRQQHIEKHMRFSDPTIFQYIKKTVSRPTVRKYLENLSKANIIICEKDNNTNVSRYNMNK